MNRISIVGIGKLGLSMAAALASRGFDVVGVDVRQDIVDSLNKGICPITETGLSQLLKENHQRLHFTTDLADAVKKTDASFIVVATPLQENNRFSNSFLEEAVKNIGQALKGHSSPHLVAVVSTVMPGTLQNIVKPLLEKTSGRFCGKDLLLAYNPEFIALGSVIRDFLEPDWILIGEDSVEAGDWLKAFYQKICLKNPSMARMSMINAEIAKLSLNCYVTAKISFANSLAAICENTPGADARTILKAVGMDSRIGGKAFMPGLGFGGPCFPRDNLAFQSFAKEFGEKAFLSESVQKVNCEQPDRLIKLIQSHVKPPAIVAILGAAYKTQTDIIEESQSIMIARSLHALGYRVRIYDPLAKSRVEAVLGSQVELSTSPEEVCQNASACLLGLPLSSDSVAEKIFARMHAPQLVIDPWNSVPFLSESKGFLYKKIGSYMG